MWGIVIRRLVVFLGVGGVVRAALDFGDGFVGVGFGVVFGVFVGFVWGSTAVAPTTRVTSIGS
jgi:hypothetical protein